MKRIQEFLITMFLTMVIVLLGWTFFDIATFAQMGGGGGSSGLQTVRPASAVQTVTAGTNIVVVTAGTERTISLDAAAQASDDLADSAVQDGDTLSTGLYGPVPSVTNQYASKIYVDNLSSRARTFYFHGATLSDLANGSTFTNFYFMSDGQVGTNAVQTHTYAAVVADDYLSAFCTASGVPGITDIQLGTYTVVAYLAKTGAKAVSVKVEAYLLDSAGATKFEYEDVAGQALTRIKTRFEWDIVLPTNVTQLVTDRWAIRFKVTSAGTPAPTVLIYTEGDNQGYMSSAAAGSSVELDPLALHLAGGTMAGNINMDGNAITNAGDIQASVQTGTYAASATNTAAQMRGAVIYVTGAATITLPAVADGDSVTIITIGNVAVSVDPDDADKIWLDGVALDDGDKITNTSAAGDIVVITYYSALGWYAATSGWTDGG